MATAKEVFEHVKTAALAATGPDERALQIDYDALENKMVAALGNRTIALFHVNQYLPEGYEDQGRFNAIAVTEGNVVYDMVLGDQYFRYDVFAAADLTKFQSIDGLYKDEEKREEVSFLSLRLQHGDEAHILLGLDEAQRASVLAVAEKLSSARYPG